MKEKLLVLGDGSLLIGVLILPFAVCGFILIIKGAIAHLEKIGEKYTLKKNWQVGLLGIIYLLSYLGFFYAVSKIH